MYSAGWGCYVGCFEVVVLFEVVCVVRGFPSLGCAVCVLHVVLCCGLGFRFLVSFNDLYVVCLLGFDLHGDGSVRIAAIFVWGFVLACCGCLLGLFNVCYC